MKRINQTVIFGEIEEEELIVDDEFENLPIETRRLIELMKECERSLSFFVTNCLISEGERKALYLAASALLRRLYCFEQRESEVNA